MRKKAELDNMQSKALGILGHNAKWEVTFHDDFYPEYLELPEPVQDKLVALTLILRERGPLLGRPQVDTLKDSRHSNMKELRFDADGGVWRVAFVFDPEKKAILLVGGDKRGADQGRFYRDLIRMADERFEKHLAAIHSKKRKY